MERLEYENHIICLFTVYDCKLIINRPFFETK